MLKRARLAASGFTSFLAVWLAGCGLTGAPLPPSLNLAEPVADLTAARIDNRVALQWTMPKRTTDKLLLAGPQRVHICRKAGDGPCVGIADLSFPPEKPASYEDVLPADLSAGDPQLLTYLVEVQNKRGRSAGDSNPAYAASGAAPLPLNDFRGEVRADGVLLEWKPVASIGQDQQVKIERTLISAGNAQKPDNGKPGLEAGAPLVKDQTLVVRMPEGKDTGKALDSDAAFDQRYTYRTARVSTVIAGGKQITLQGAVSPEVTVDTKDVFPPRPPAELIAVTVPDQAAIDLSWTPNTEPDLAGYSVYRREAGQPAASISGQKLLDAPAFRDSTAQPGREYTYFVTAVDRDGNESGRSAGATETLPPKP